MMVTLMRVPAGTGAAPHSHPNERWMYVLEGNFRITLDGRTVEARPGSVAYVPAELVHATQAGARRLRAAGDLRLR